MDTIRATISPRLLTKASRMFDGTTRGIITEILQNARRAGATHVDIRNRQDGIVEVRDNGKGIDDFAKLLALGDSGWDPSLEDSEDPAGVGLFCLAPHPVSVVSKGHAIHLTRDGWTGGAVTVHDVPELPAVGATINAGQGTHLAITTEAWTNQEVEPLAMFSGMQVHVDGSACAKSEFLGGEEAVEYPELGCRIAIVEPSQWSRQHNYYDAFRYSYAVLVNFYGQLIQHQLPTAQMRLYGCACLVQMTGTPTPIRMVLPARTHLVENAGATALAQACLLEFYRYQSRQPEHTLSYQDYQAAHAMGVNLREAKPVYNVGLLTGDDPSPMPVSADENFLLAQCYRAGAGLDDDAEANAHLLAAQGTFQRPFVPVYVGSQYNGYSWANLPTIDRVEVVAGDTVKEDFLGCGTLRCVQSLELIATCSDGQVFRSAVKMALAMLGPEEASGGFLSGTVLVTREAENTVEPSQVWYHLGGASDDSEADSYDTQADDFAKAWAQFWDTLRGPTEALRVALLGAATLHAPRDWKSLALTRSGVLTLQRKSDKK
jgi:hypothetical protein